MFDAEIASRELEELLKRPSVSSLPAEKVEQQFFLYLNTLFPAASIKNVEWDGGDNVTVTRDFSGPSEAWSVWQA